ncbi:carbohydrate-binding family 9-like protein [Parabacteroides sp. OttesenSCG-928-K15]|nr:carbohydrate-binding family 9-like protein [Parabacteroides sp. OttesenSCG-928-K15]
MKRTILFLFMLSVLTSCAEKRTKEVWYAERAPFIPPVYVCYKAPAKIVVDGKLSPEEWGAIPPTTDFVDIEGVIRPLPTLKTQLKMTHDEHGMYFGVLLEEPHIWATITEHDDVIFRDNDFEIFLNPSNDTHNYLEYEVNALGTVWDLYLSRPYRDDPVVLNNYEFMGMQSAVHVEGTLNNPNDTDKYWSLEVFIPWYSIYQVMRTEKKPAEGAQMRMNFSRVEWITEVRDGKYVKIPMPGEEKVREHNWVWAPTGVINIHMPEYWGYVQFTETIAGVQEVPFVWNSDEDIKWTLRQLYYRQREFHQAYNTYATNLADMKPEEICPEEWLKGLSVTASDRTYEISLQKDEETNWHIRQDGLVYATMQAK